MVTAASLTPPAPLHVMLFVVWFSLGDPPPHHYDCNPFERKDGDQVLGPGLGPGPALGPGQVPGPVLGPGLGLVLGPGPRPEPGPGPRPGPGPGPRPGH